MGKTTIDRRWLPLNALRAFEGVAKHSSFTAAANALLISQSALSRHVIALEKLIGAQLFERRPHALVLTKAGQHLLPAVQKSFDRLEYALDDTAIALFRSWLIERFGSGPASAASNIHLVVSNE
jgi:DNA-binding transcriptional LysR family regulator